MVRALLEAEDEATPLPFVGSALMQRGVQAVVNAISHTLGLDLAHFRHGDPNDNHTPKRGFDYLRDRAERAGIYVLLIGNLGSHHSNFDVEIFRGFALADPVAPFIVINDQDAKAAWSFTLLHELAHIWLGQTGVSGENAASAIEQFCNDVAGRFLLPDQEIRNETPLGTAPFENVVARVNEIADQRQVSCSMVAYKLYRQNVIDKDTWNQLRAFYRQQWIHNRQADRSRERDHDRGPNYYVVRRHRLGARLINLTRRFVAEGALVPSKAAKILGVKPSNVFGLIGDQTRQRPGQAA
jgi:Zn-dependent peptidase ImmA (M78 family)